MVVYERCELRATPPNGVTARAWPLSRTTSFTYKVTKARDTTPRNISRAVPAATWIDLTGWWVLFVCPGVIQEYVHWRTLAVLIAEGTQMADSRGGEREAEILRKKERIMVLREELMLEGGWGGEKGGYEGGWRYQESAWFYCVLMNALSRSFFCLYNWNETIYLLKRLIIIFVFKTWVRGWLELVEGWRVSKDIYLGDVPPNQISHASSLLLIAAYTVTPSANLIDSCSIHIYI